MDPARAPLLAMSLRTAASMYLQRRRYSKALPLAEEAVQVARGVGGASLVVSLVCLAEVYNALGRYIEAADAMSEADKDPDGEPHESPREVRIGGNSSGLVPVGPDGILVMKNPVEAALRSWLSEVGESSAMIYLANDVDSAAVEHAVVEVLRAFGQDVATRLPEIRGSWFLRLRLSVKAWAGSESAKDLLAELEHSARVRLLHAPIAEVDERKSAAVAALITALESQQTAMVMLGSILILKMDGVLAVRDLSSHELAFMARNPSMVRQPADLLVGLDQVVRDAGASRPPGRALDA
ncbi:tetratricopeptide repeat protein [Nonomuraea sp. NPDC055795]